ncbi:hypothetical protein CEE45_01445 [Candidatus Heimdallarchaeota archaeon B3_Heim]|nr:MAG: hypothetical protein CEE45_01445 [Candidatus Heimdallarchaeota archaeon B3_Heim]
MSDQVKFLLRILLLGFILIVTIVSIVMPETSQITIIRGASMLLLILGGIYTIINYNKRFSFAPE